MKLSSNDRRRVLLIDNDSQKQRMRAAALRNFEIEVLAASDLDEARKLWMEAAYDLILLAAEEDSEIATIVREELRVRRPRQRIALLVGAPLYIREIGRKRIALREAPRPVFDGAYDAMAAQPNQWQVMMNRLLAAG